MRPAGRDEVGADFRGLDYVAHRGAHAVTKGSFAIEDREPCLKRTS